MKIAVPTDENNQIDNHSENFSLFTIFLVSEKFEIIAETQIESLKDSDSNSFIVAYDLAQFDVDVILANTMNEELIKEFKTRQIETTLNFQGDVHEQINEYLLGKIMEWY